MLLKETAFHYKVIHTVSNNKYEQNEQIADKM
jgi:hypothetical protein